MRLKGCQVEPVETGAIIKQTVFDKLPEMMGTSRLTANLITTISNPYATEIAGIKKPSGLEGLK